MKIMVGGVQFNGVTLYDSFELEAKSLDKRFVIIVLCPKLVHQLKSIIPDNWSYFCGPGLRGRVQECPYLCGIFGKFNYS
jgi:hypothetical protein